MTTGQRVAEFFHEYARDFDAIYGSDHGVVERVVNRLFRKSMRLRYERTIAGCQPIAGKAVIDIGCGPGHYGIALARAGAARVVGVDVASGMLDLARAKAAEAGVAARCEFLAGDFTTMTWPERFDYAIVMGVMDYIAVPRAMTERVLAVTRGTAFFSFPAAGGLLGWQRQLRYRKRCDLFLYEEADVRRAFPDRGYRELVVERLARDFFVTCRVQ
jgi:2-polyprenyl-3-methyl-5-hydroxy-6-metoxy-1,4-benzoquinol methylase